MTTCTTATRWREVRGACPACGHRGWCRTSPNGELIACRRQDHGAVRRIDYSDGSQAWLHAPNGRRSQGTAPPLTSAKPDAPRAADADLDRVYRALLAAPDLHLQRDHRQHLLGRGLTDEDLAIQGYRSLPATCRAGILRHIQDRFPVELLLTIPGIVARDGPHGRYLTLCGRAGIIIPIRSAAGLIVGLVIRPDDPGEGGKYRWISSRRHDGPSPGSRVHVPAGAQPSESVTLTEGALKANVAHALSGKPIIGMPGPHVTHETIATLKALGARTALLALDADVRTNAHVAQAQADGLARLKGAGFEYGILRWEPDEGKGIDDVYLAMKKGAV